MILAPTAAITRRTCRLNLLASKALATGLMIFAPTSVEAGPVGETIVAGKAVVSRPDAATTVVSQSSGSVLIDWRSFSIGARETTRFVQPAASSLAINRVTDGQATSIFGSLTANGQVAIINPAGILIGAGARVDVGGLVASAHMLSDE